MKSNTTSGQLDMYSQTYPAQMYSLVEASSGQEKYYIRSALHFLICCSAIGEVSHTFQ